ncbi:MAG: UDP-N-acetylmuramate dehydrogenase [Bacteroidales bacterium]|nr:UDP-N-acetylmuramate dehydrogenase [Bacteroidales bacterium]
MIKRISDFDLSGRNTFRMRVRCAMFVEVSEEADLEALDWDSLPRPVKVIGGGSNLLFTGDFPGTLIHFSGGLSMAGPSPCPCPGVDRPTEACTATASHITLPSGTVFDEFCEWAAGSGLWGPENLSLIPGEVGASAVQNIGAYGVEAKDIIAGIRAWDMIERRFVDIDPEECEYGYRASRFKTEWKDRFVITAVTFRLSREPRPRLDYGGLRKALEGKGKLTPELIRRVIIDIRNSKLPPVEKIGSAGSFFCNPIVPCDVYEKVLSIARSERGDDAAVPHFDLPEGVKIPAAWLIDTCGLKGAERGGAAVYQNQPLVIVNASGAATPADILALERHIIDSVFAKYGITLHPEVEHVGDIENKNQ